MSCPGCGWSHHDQPDRLADQLERLDQGEEHAEDLENIVVIVLHNRTRGGHSLIAAEAKRRHDGYAELASRFDPRSTR